MSQKPRYKEQSAPTTGGLLPLPKNSAQNFKDFEARLQNIGLYFDRYIRFADLDWQMAYQVQKQNNPRKTDTLNAKLWNLQKLANTQDAINRQWDQSIFIQVINRWLETARSQKAELFPLTPEWRFAVGLGNESAIENGFTFHRLYGFPIIPGSALKGLARAAALVAIADSLGVTKLSLSQVKERGDKKKTPLEKLEGYLLANDERIRDAEHVRKAKNEENKAWKELGQEVKQLEMIPDAQSRIDQFRRIFGTQHAAGEAIFFDAMPAEAPSLEIDVMNVHYPDYYGKDEYPTDSQNPTPIPFLTVGRTPFWFAVGRRKPMDSDAYEQAVTWLKTGLTEFGIGAKTAAGYGYFEVK